MPLIADDGGHRRLTLRREGGVTFGWRTLHVLVDGEEAARIRHPGAVTIVVPDSAETLRVTLDGIGSRPVDLSTTDGDATFRIRSPIPYASVAIGIAVAFLLNAVFGIAMRFGDWANALSYAVCCGAALLLLERDPRHVIRVR